MLNANEVEIPESADVLLNDTTIDEPELDKVDDNNSTSALTAENDG